MNKTSIAWTDYTSNPLRATNIETGFDGHYCEKVDPACAGCYASEQNARGAYPHASTGIAYPANPPGSKADTSAVRGKLRFWLNETELREWSKPKYAGSRCFPFDMTDLFGEWVPDEWLDKIFAAMALASGVTFQVLTKRPERMRAYLTEHLRGELRFIHIEHAWRELGMVAPAVSFWPLPNVWLGVTAGNQRWLDHRVAILLDTPAALRFVSYEPALGPVDFGFGCWVRLGQRVRSDLPGVALSVEAGVHRAERNRHGAMSVNGLGIKPDEFECTDIGWVIVGGESGREPRAMDPAWARSVVAQCREAGVPVFVKQMGGKRFPDDSLASLPEEFFA